MNAQEIMNSEDFQRCAAFHGHICPGLSIGYRAAKAGMAWLAEQRAEDEEVVAVVETDACSADAVQVLTGCTFGKGNFIFRDHGKMVLTILSRKNGKGVRVSLRPEAFSPDAEHIALIRKVTGGEASPAEEARFRELHLQRSRDLLERPVGDLFELAPAEMAMPGKARIEPSEPCARCGEPTMPSKMESIDGKKICRGCL
jgi:formylmethanofuran dehydrogenase subunit E